MRRLSSTLPPDFSAHLCVRSPVSEGAGSHLKVGTTYKIFGAAGRAEFSTLKVCGTLVRVTFSGWSVISGGKYSRNRVVAMIR